jgi:hypothetical protein
MTKESMLETPIYRMRGDTSGLVDVSLLESAIAKNRTKDASRRSQRPTPGSKGPVLMGHRKEVSH